MKVLLGPCRCQGCGFAVVWATARNGKQATWRDAGTGDKHLCAALARVA